MKLHKLHPVSHTALMIRGAGGGKGGGEPYEAPDSLRSRATARVMDVVSQGPIKGLVDGMKSIYLNDTQLQADDDDFNFNGVSVQERLGYPDQSPVTGFGGTRVPIAPPSSGDPLEYNEPRTQTITASPVAPDAVALTFQVGPFLKRKDNGDIVGTSVSVQIEVEGITAYNMTITGKQDESYQRQVRIDLDQTRFGAGPWDIRVTRTTQNDADIKHQDDILWTTIEAVYDDDFIYPNSAYYAISFDAEAFGNSVPRRGFEIEGMLVEIPDNYDPVTREYSGMWAGSFAGAEYTNNPAMCLRDLIRNDRYGAGNVIPPSLIDDAALYQIAQYCDGRVYDGTGTQSISILRVGAVAVATVAGHTFSIGDYIFIKGAAQDEYNGVHKITGVSGDDVNFSVTGSPASPATGSPVAGYTEPRFTFNHQFTSQEDAINVLQAMATIFQGMLYYLNNKIIAVADMPKDPTMAVSPANVIGGDFSYSSNVNRLRHSVALVTWNDPEALYKKQVEVIERPDLIQSIGWRPLNLTVIGCTSRGQAHRFGQWALYAEKYEAEFISYRAGFDHATLAPGEIVAINDPTKSNKRAGGRILSATTTSITVDGDVEIPVGDNEVYITMPDGTLATRTLTNGSGTTDELTWSTALSEAPLANSMWVASLADLSPRLFRVLKVAETDPGVYEVNAMLYQPAKFDFVDSEIYLKPKETVTLPERTKISPPTDVAASVEFIVYGNRIVPYIDVTWTAPSDPYLDYTKILVRHENGNWEEAGTAEGQSFKIQDPSVGTWEIRVVAVNKAGATSTASDGSDTVSIEYTGDEVPSATGLTLIEGLELYNQGNDTEFRHRDAKFSWIYVSPNQEDDEFADGTVSKDIVFKDFVVQVWNGNVLVREDSDIKDTTYTYTLEKNLEDQERLNGNGADPLRTFTFMVAMRDIFDNYSAFTKLTVSNPAPSVPLNVRAEGTVGGIEGSWDVPLNLLDYSGALLHMSDTTPFTPDANNQIRDIKDGSEFYVNLGPEATKYFKVALYDTFGKTGLNYSAEFSSTVPLKIDTTAPSIPTGTGMTSSIITDSNGDQRVKLIVTLDRNVEADMSFYDIAIKEGAGNFVTYAVPQVDSGETPTLEVLVSPNMIYYAKARAIDESGNKSGYSSEIYHTTVADTIAPASPTGLAILAGLRTIELSWTNPTDNDFSHTEIYEGPDATFANASLIKKAFGTRGIRSGLTTGTSYYYWIKAVDTSGNASSEVGPVSTTAQYVQTVDISIAAVTTPLIANENITETLIATDAISTRTIAASAITANELAANSVTATAILAGTITANELAAGTITANELSANSVTATQLAADSVTTNAIASGTIITDHMAAGSIDADRLQAGTALAATITVSGTALSSTTSWASDPAARVNTQSTQIDPGKILISGGTSLSNWRYGGDNTLIDGGNIAANTVTANTLYIGSRGITIAGLQFTPLKGSNQISWSSGSIVYVDDSGNKVEQSVSSGSASWSSGTRYIYWVKGSSTLSSTLTRTTAQGANNVILATYQGGTDMVANYGRTIVDGSTIITGTITASQLTTSSAVITNTAQIQNLLVDTIHIANASVTKTAVAQTTSNNTVNEGTPEDLGTTSFTPENAGNSVILLTVTVQLQSASDTNTTVRIRGRDSASPVNYADIPFRVTISPGETQTHTIVFRFTEADTTGPYYYELAVESPSSASVVRGASRTQVVEYIK